MDRRAWVPDPVATTDRRVTSAAAIVDAAAIVTVAIAIAIATADATTVVVVDVATATAAVDSGTSRFGGRGRVAVPPPHSERVLFGSSAACANL